MRQTRYSRRVESAVTFIGWEGGWVNAWTGGCYFLRVNYFVGFLAAEEGEEFLEITRRDNTEVY